MNRRPFRPLAPIKTFVLYMSCLFFVLCPDLFFAAPVLSDAGGLSYYVFSRSDFHLCPSPDCGGMFVRRVNRFLTLCGDGLLRTDCYVAGLDLSPLGLQDDDASRVQAAFTAKEALIRGSFVPFSNEFPTLSVLAAAEAWEEKGTGLPGFIFAVFRDNGTRCITEPCSWVDASILNIPFTGTVSGIDLGSSGASPEDIAEGYRSLSSTGTIATGRLKMISGPAGKGLSFEAARFYLKVQNGLVCGGAAKVQCPNDMFCDIEPPDACSGQDRRGTCTFIPQTCAMIYAPVCGCDGKTYASDCERLASQVLLIHTGECTMTGGN